MLKFEPCVVFASLEILDIARTVQEEKQLFSLQKKVNANARESMLSGRLAETHGYDNTFIESAERLVASCNKHNH